MPNEVKTLEGGKLSVRLETGEVFEGDPLEVTNKMAAAHVETKRWGQSNKQAAETTQQQLDAYKASHPEPVVQSTNANPQDAQLQTYLVDQWAKGLGYQNADEAKAVLGKVVNTTEEVNNQLVASAFLQACPEFPNSPEAIEALSKRIDDMKWDFSPQSMIAAHAMLTRENQSDGTKGYKPLTPEQMNSQWANDMSNASRRGTPPPMVRSGNPENQSGVPNPYAMPLADLRAAAIKQELEGRR